MATEGFVYSASENDVERKKFAAARGQFLVHILSDRARELPVRLAHTMLVMAYYMAKRQCPYQELGGDYFDRRNADTMQHRLVKKLKNLGYEVTLTPITAPPTA